MQVRWPKVVPRYDKQSETHQCKDQHKQRPDAAGEYAPQLFPPMMLLLVGVKLLLLQGNELLVSLGVFFGNLFGANRRKGFHWLAVPDPVLVVAQNQSVGNDCPLSPPIPVDLGPRRIGLMSDGR